jgi:hypothetical protein
VPVPVEAHPYQRDRHAAKHEKCHQVEVGHEPIEGVIPRHL